MCRSVHLIRSNAFRSASYCLIAASCSVSFRVTGGRTSGLESASSSRPDPSSGIVVSVSRGKGEEVVRSISIVSSSRTAGVDRPLSRLTRPNAGILKDRLVLSSSRGGRGIISSRSIPANEDPRKRACGMTVADISPEQLAKRTSYDSDSHVERTWCY
jgi:hypothetical protein